MYVYLAGPITGLTFEKASEWRDDPLLVESLAKQGYVTLNPLRGKPHLSESRDPLPARYTDAQEMMEVTQDLGDIDKASAVLANLRDVTHVSVGTCWELGYAYAKQKPVVTVISHGGPYDHLFVHRTSYKVVQSMFEAVAALEELAPLLRGPVYA